MATSLRFVIIILITAIVVAATFAVYAALDLNDDGHATGEFGGIENFVWARDVKKVPKIEFMDEAGDKLTLKDFKGKIVLLNLWATWCTPCVAEMPMLDRLQEKMEEHDVVVMALSIDRGGAEPVREFYDEHGIEHLQIYVDPTMSAQSDLHAAGLPTTILIDRKGRERGRISGAVNWDDDRAIGIIMSAEVPPH